jgi:hypothetical protein
MPSSLPSQSQGSGDAPDFSALTPDAVIDAVETALGIACTNLCRPLNSYINRVYEVGIAEGGFVIAKFYRPRRWSRDALQDELDFLRELQEAEVPVAPPLPGRDGALLHDLSGTAFAVLAKKGGRPLDEPTPNEWVHLGRLIGRLHAVDGRQRSEVSGQRSEVRFLRPTSAQAVGTLALFLFPLPLRERVRVRGDSRHCSQGVIRPAVGHRATPTFRKRFRNCTG